MFNKKRLIQTESLEYFIKIKKILGNKNIQYFERTSTGNGWIQFLTLLFISGRGSYGQNNEHIQHYLIYVYEDNYNQAIELISRGVDENET